MCNFQGKDHLLPHWPTKITLYLRFPEFATATTCARAKTTKIVSVLEIPTTEKIVSWLPSALNADETVSPDPATLPEAPNCHNTTEFTAENSRKARDDGKVLAAEKTTKQTIAIELDESAEIPKVNVANTF